MIHCKNFSQLREPLPLALQIKSAGGPDLDKHIDALRLAKEKKTPTPFKTDVLQFKNILYTPRKALLKNATMVKLGVALAKSCTQAMSTALRLFGCQKKVSHSSPR